MSDRQTALERAGETGALAADGFDEAIVGTAYMIDSSMELLVYDRARMIDVLVERDRISYEDAREYLEFNTWGAYMGVGTPIFMDLFEPEEEDEGAHPPLVSEEQAVFDREAKRQQDADEGIIWDDDH